MARCKVCGEDKMLRGGICFLCAVRHMKVRLQKEKTNKYLQNERDRFLYGP